MSTRPTLRRLDSGEIIRVDGGTRNLVRCHDCQALPDTMALARRGLCRRCSFPAAVAVARKLLASGPKPAATMVNLLVRLGLEHHDDPRVRGVLEAALVDVYGVPCWALPQHQELPVDDPFHVELAAMLDSEMTP